MKTRAIILAGGEGSRLGVLTAKRTKPAMPFAGRYRIIDFTLSNCVNSNISDIMIVAQYLPQSLMDHIGAGGAWDLNRDFSGGVKILTPFKARFGTDWFLGTADAIHQNWSFIKKNRPDLVLLLCGDHVYSMDYDVLITFHLDHRADITLATIRVPLDEASRYGVVEVQPDYRISSFVEKPSSPRSDLINMGVYVFNMETLENLLLQDHLRKDSSHDFGKDILPKVVAENYRVFAFPFSGYWMDVGTIQSYWQAHMDLLLTHPELDLSRSDWVIHTRREDRPPAIVRRDVHFVDSLISNGCLLETGARVEYSILSAGVIIHSGAYVSHSIIMADTVIGSGAIVDHAILDKRVQVGENVKIGAARLGITGNLTLVGKNSIIPPGVVIEPGASIEPDVVPSDFETPVVHTGETIITKRLPHEI